MIKRIHTIKTSSSPTSVVCLLWTGGGSAMPGNIARYITSSVNKKIDIIEYCLNNDFTNRPRAHRPLFEGLCRKLWHQLPSERSNQISFLPFSNGETLA